MPQPDPLQAGTMLHPAAKLRNAPNMTPSRSWAPWTTVQSGLRPALDPSTTWVSPSNRHASIMRDIIRTSQDYSTR